MVKLAFLKRWKISIKQHIGILRNPDSDPKKTRTREKPGLVLGLAFEKPGLDNRKPGLQIVKYWIR